MVNIIIVLLVTSRDVLLNWKQCASQARLRQRRNNGWTIACWTELTQDILCTTDCVVLLQYSMSASQYSPFTLYIINIIQHFRDISNIA